MRGGLHPPVGHFVRDLKLESRHRSQPGGGFKSLADLLIPPAGPNGVIDRRPEPSYNLSDQECDVWRSIVNSMAAEHFQPVHYPLLAQTCRHVVASDFIAAMMQQHYKAKRVDLESYSALLALQRTESAIINQLLRSMRLTHQSLYRGESSKVRPLTLDSNPWDRKRVTDKVKP